MIKIGQEVTSLQKRIIELYESQKVLNVQPPKQIEQKVEYSNNSGNLIMDVRFLGNEGLSFEERQKKCEAFLMEIVSVFKKHGVSKLTGNYVRENI